ncbi:hypothetical protein CR513_57411, partial [Mucuna pruriens]
MRTRCSHKIVLDSDHYSALQVSTTSRPLRLLVLRKATTEESSTGNRSEKRPSSAMNMERDT